MFLRDVVVNNVKELNADESVPVISILTQVKYGEERS